MKRSKLISLCALSAPLMVAAANSAEEQQPNVLWIITDDQRADALECWNRAVSGKSESALGYVSSPCIDELASEGVIFTRSFCNASLSGPSRASMHTGLYPHHNGMFNFQLKHNEHDNAKPMIPEVMRAEGYSTAAFGKLGYYIYKYSEPMTFKYSDTHYEQMLSERAIEAAKVGDFSWISPKKGDKELKTEEWYYPDGTSVGYKLFAKAKDDNPENRAILEKFYEDHEVILKPASNNGEIIAGRSSRPTEDTEDGRIAAAVVEYLENENNSYTSIIGTTMQGADTTKPQMVYAGFHFPHTPVMPSQEYRDMFKDKVYTIPLFEDWEVDKMSQQVQTWQSHFSLESFTEAQKQQCIQDYYAFCAMGDKLVGDVVDSFKAYCERNDQEYVIIFACGDHGWHLGEQGTCFKNSAFLKSNETAMIVVSSDKKKFPAGKVVDDLVEYVDIAPTLYAAAGCDLDCEEFDFLDGRDLAATASGKVKPRDYVLGEIASYGNRAYMRSTDFAFSMRSRKSNSVPTKEYLPNADIMWALECTPEEAQMGLYDLRVDPLERNNVAYDPDYQELAAWFRVKLGNIVLGDDRFEAVWDEKNLYNVSSFAQGSDDKVLDIPKKIIPKVKR